MINQIKKLISLLKGTAYYRFSISLVTLGVSMFVPAVWEFAIYALIYVFRSIYSIEVEFSMPAHEKYNEIPPIIIGSILIIIGILNFLYWHRLKVNADSDLADQIKKVGVLNLWSYIRDIDSNADTANIDDVTSAINILNATSVILNDSSVEVIKHFKKIKDRDFLTLFNKLTSNKYRVYMSGREETSERLLLDEVYKLKEKITDNAL